MRRVDREREKSLEDDEEEGRIEDDDWSRILLVDDTWFTFCKKCNVDRLSSMAYDEFGEIAFVESLGVTGW